MHNTVKAVLPALCAAAASLMIAAPAHAAGSAAASAPLSPPGHSSHGRGHSLDTRTNDHWSGYSAHSGTYGSVEASWTEPTVDCSQGGEVVFWIGLDGDGNQDVEQTGTHVICQGGQPVYTGWWETAPCNAIQDYNDALQPGDQVEARVRDTGSGYELYLHDITQGWTEDPTVQACESTGDVSAEVITETPLYSNGPSPLADFGTVTYTAAKIDGKALSDAGPQPIDMARNGQTMDTTSAITSGGTEFSNTWQSAG